MSIKAKKILAVLVLLAIIDAVFLFPILGASLIYIVLQRPPWFMNIVREIYEEPSV